MVRFQCTLCGNCCSHPEIIITLTHRDIVRLYKWFNDINFIASNVVAIIGPYLENLVMPQLRISGHNSIIALLKMEGRCIFLSESNQCSIYEYRPLVCRAFPFTFKKEKTYLTWGFSKKANICEGIGIGPELSDDDLIQLGKPIVEELEEFKNFARDWNLSVFSKLQNDSIRALISKILDEYL